MAATLTGVMLDVSAAPVRGARVSAGLVAALELLPGGGAIIRGDSTVTAADGSWSLVLTPTDDLAMPEGAYYVVESISHRWTVALPTDGVYTLDEVLVAVPGPLPGLGATTAALAAGLAALPVIRAWDGEAYELAEGATIYLGGPTDPTQNDGDIWIREE